jgi:hypothetical protein
MYIYEHCGKMKLTSSCPYMSAKWYRSGPRFIQTCHHLSELIPWWKIAENIQCFKQLQGTHPPIFQNPWYDFNVFNNIVCRINKKTSYNCIPNSCISYNYSP